MIRTVMLIGIVLWPGLALQAASPSQTSGVDLFGRYCVRCHTAGPAALETDPSRVGSVLRDGGIPAHYFTLDNKEVDAIVHYLEAETDAAPPSHDPGQQ